MEPHTQILVLIITKLSMLGLMIMTATHAELIQKIFAGSILRLLSAAM